MVSPYSRCHKEIMFMSADCRLESLLHHDYALFKAKLAKDRTADILRTQSTN